MDNHAGGFLLFREAMTFSTWNDNREYFQANFKRKYKPKPRADTLTNVHTDNLSNVDNTRQNKHVHTRKYWYTLPNPQTPNLKQILYPMWLNIGNIRGDHSNQTLPYSTQQFPRCQKELPMRPIRMPERAKARRADWAPGPGVFVLFPPVARSLMWRAVMPNSWMFWGAKRKSDQENADIH
jgi:hypothetical protein